MDQQKLNFAADFSSAVSPFRIAVHDEFLELTKAKLALTRFVDTELDEPASTDGPPTSVAREIAAHWLHQYDWRAVGAGLNASLSQFTTVVQPSTSPAAYVHPVPLHFVHRRSSRADAMPLLFVHGWPGSFLEVQPIISALTDPQDAAHPAFHVVAPSIPGYGFSPTPRHGGMGYRAAAAAFHALMAQLGYARFVLQGGDAGDVINRYLAHDFAQSAVAAHSNFWIVPVPPGDEGDEEAQAAADTLHAFWGQRWAYGQIQQTHPLRLAAAMTDSPVGLAMWVYDALAASVEPERVAEFWTPERVVTWVMMHWVNGPYGVFGLYRQGAKDGAIGPEGIRMMPYVSQPVAVSQFPYDMGFQSPERWLRRQGNVLVRTVHGRGGHFPALTDPEALLADVRAFFGDRERSGTKVFGVNAV